MTTDEGRAAAAAAERIANGEVPPQPKFPVGEPVHYVPPTGKCTAAIITDRVDSPDDSEHMYQIIVCFPAKAVSPLAVGQQQRGVMETGGWVQVLNVPSELIGIDDEQRTGSVHAGFIHARHL